jgi:hypothetical protein
VKARNCAWVDIESPANKRVVWARQDVFSMQCPKSIITAESMAYLERHAAWKQFGVYDPEMLTAKTADAIVFLEQAWRRESKNGEID